MLTGWSAARLYVTRVGVNSQTSLSGSESKTLTRRDYPRRDCVESNLDTTFQAYNVDIAF